jgi:hypothetical protein
MHTHDLENHDNLYADELEMRPGESGGDARKHAVRALVAILAMLGLLGGLAAMNHGMPLG